MPTDSIDKRWKAISAVGAIVASTATAIFRPPPVGDPQSFISLGTLLSSVTSGLLYVAMMHFSAKRHVLAWIAAAIAGTAGAVWCHSYYGTLTDTRVAVYQDQQFVIGDDYTAEGAAWAAANGHDSNALLFDFSGVATNAWTRESIERVKGRMRLSITLSSRWSRLRSSRPFRRSTWENDREDGRAGQMSMCVPTSTLLERVLIVCSLNASAVLGLFLSLTQRREGAELSGADIDFVSRGCGSHKNKQRPEYKSNWTDWLL